MLLLGGEIMNTFTVQQVADILKTNPETVRRWIRSGKLKAEKTSNKTGNVILASSLENFGKIMPKYNDLIAKNLVDASVSATLLGAATVLTASVIGGVCKAKAEEISKSEIDFNEMKKFILSELNSRKKALIEKEKTLAILQKEISDEKEKINNLNELLNRINSGRLGEQHE